MHTPFAKLGSLRARGGKAVVVAAAFAFLVVIPEGNLLHQFSPTLSPTVTAGSNAHARGAELFATHGCAHCHGTDGINGEIGPDLQQLRKRMTTEQIFKQIHDGSKNMPAFVDTLSTPQIDDLVAYLRTKRKHIIPPPPPAPTPKPDPDGN